MKYKIRSIRNVNIGKEWDKLAPNTDNAIAYAYKHINPEPSVYIAPHKYSMEYCLAHYGSIINNRYRRGYGLDQTDKDIAKMLAKHNTDTDLVLYRGISEWVLECMIENAKDKNCDLYEKGFLCCSLVKGQEIENEFKLRIFVPQRYNVVYMGNVNEEQEYYEVDVQCGTKINIISIDNEYINCKIIE